MQGQNYFMDLKLSYEAWYVFYTASRCEKKVAKSLSDRGVKFYLPLHLSPRFWSDRIKLVEIPLFPSYIFVYCSLAQIEPLLQIPHLSHIIRIGGKAVEVREREITDIQAFLEIAKSCPLCEGDEAEVIFGQMKDFRGRVHKVGKKHAILYVESLNAKICVCLEYLTKK